MALLEFFDVQDSALREVRVRARPMNRATMPKRKRLYISVF
jgi:hypothetical protein